MNAIERIGAAAVEQWRTLRYVAAVIWSVVVSCLRPRMWRRTVASEFSRQIFSVGVMSAGFISAVACAVGVSVVAQALVWSPKIGQSKLLGPLLITVLIREVVPVLTNLLAVGRSGAPIAAELATMRVGGQVNVLEAQGIDPFDYLVVPRVLGFALSIFVLSVTFVVVAFASGYLACLLLGVTVSDPVAYTRQLLESLRPVDIASFAAKSLLPALLTGGICCIVGLRAARWPGSVAAAPRRGTSRSVFAVLVTSALVSLMTYL